MENKCCEKCRVRCRCPEPHAPGHGDKCANKSCPCHSPAPRESAKELLYGFWKEYYEISRWDRDSVIEKHADILEAKLEAARREGAESATERIKKLLINDSASGYVDQQYLIDTQEQKEAWNHTIGRAIEAAAPTQHREGSN